MKQQLLVLFMAILMLAALSGCGTTVNEADSGEEFVLSPGQSIGITGEDFTIKFIEVISDSRCPQGATCIWAGEANCLVEITIADTTYRKVLTQSDHSVPSKTNFNDYEISYDLQPYPEVNKETNKKDYHLQMVISRLNTVQRFYPWSARISII